MEYQNSSYWAPVSHEDPRRDSPQPDTYALYPAEWRRNTARETSEANQQRTRNSGAGLGQPYDAEYLATVAQRDMSAELAANAVRSQVELG